MFPDHTHASRVFARTEADVGDLGPGLSEDQVASDRGLLHGCRRGEAGNAEPHGADPERRRPGPAQKGAAIQGGVDRRGIAARVLTNLALGLRFLLLRHAAALRT